jgi:hypothetical protein
MTGRFLQAIAAAMRVLDVGYAKTHGEARTHVAHAPGPGDDSLRFPATQNVQMDDRDVDILRHETEQSLQWG